MGAGACANMVETEQLLSVNGNLFSFVQVRRELLRPLLPATCSFRPSLIAATATVTATAACHRPRGHEPTAVHAKKPPPSLAQAAPSGSCACHVGW